MNLSTDDARFTQVGTARFWRGLVGGGRLKPKQHANASSSSSSCQMELPVSSMKVAVHHFTILCEGLWSVHSLV